MASGSIASYGFDVSGLPLRTVEVDHTYLGWVVVTSPNCAYPCEIITGQWNNSYQISGTMFDATQQFFSRMLGAAEQIGQIEFFSDVPPSDFDFTIPEPDAWSDDFPVDDDLDFTFRHPEEVGDISFRDVREIDAGDAPEFTGEAPSIVLPPKPVKTTIAKPGAAPTVDDPTFGDAPDLAIPVVPTLRELELPNVPSIEEFSFDGVAPTDDLAAPDVTFNWSEDDYSSQLLTEINNNFLNTLQNGSTGLPKEAEDALYQRARDRLTQASQAQKQEIMETFAARGFDMPNGVILDAVQRVVEERYKAENELNRDVFIDQAKRAWEFTVQTLTLGVQLENQLLNYATQVQNRAFEAAKYSVQAALDVYAAKVETFKARVSVYQTYAEVYRIQVEAELTKLERYKAQLEGQRMINELNRADIDIFTARLESLQTQVELYKTEIQAESEKTRAQAIQVDAFKSTVDAYVAQIQGQSEEYKAYKTEVEAEIAKIQSYETEVNAYGARVGAYKTLIDARRAVQDSDIEQNKAQVLKLQSDVERFKAELLGETSRLEANSTVFNTRVETYKSRLAGLTAYTQSNVSLFEAKVREAVSRGDLALKKAEIELTNATRAMEAVMNANEVGAKVASAIGSAALATVSTNVSYSQKATDDLTTVEGF